jgi:hypothetical protein
MSNIPGGQPAVVHTQAHRAAIYRLQLERRRHKGVGYLWAGSLKELEGPACAITDLLLMFISVKVPLHFPNLSAVPQIPFMDKISTQWLNEVPIQYLVVYRILDRYANHC